MSWDVMVFNYHGSPPTNLDELPDDHKPDPIGEINNVRQTITELLPGIDWTTESRAIYRQNGLTVELNIGRDPLVDSIALHVRGVGDPVDSLCRLTNPNRWSLFDCQLGEFLDPNAPSPRGWNEFLATESNAPCELCRQSDSLAVPAAVLEANRVEVPIVADTTLREPSPAGTERSASKMLFRLALGSSLAVAILGTMYTLWFVPLALLSLAVNLNHWLRSNTP